MGGKREGKGEGTCWKKRGFQAPWPWKMQTAQIPSFLVPWEQRVSQDSKLLLLSALGMVSSWQLFVCSLQDKACPSPVSQGQQVNPQ